MAEAACPRCSSHNPLRLELAPAAQRQRAGSHLAAWHLLPPFHNRSIVDPHEHNRRSWRFDQAFESATVGVSRAALEVTPRVRSCIEACRVLHIIRSACATEVTLVAGYCLPGHGGIHTRGTGCIRLGCSNTLHCIHNHPLSVVMLGDAFSARPGSCWACLPCEADGPIRSFTLNDPCGLPSALICATHYNILVRGAMKTGMWRFPRLSSLRLTCQHLCRSLWRIGGLTSTSDTCKHPHGANDEWRR